MYTRETNRRPNAHIAGTNITNHSLKKQIHTAFLLELNFLCSLVLLFLLVYYSAHPEPPCCLFHACIPGTRGGFSALICERPPSLPRCFLNESTLSSPHNTFSTSRPFSPSLCTSGLLQRFCFLSLLLLPPTGTQHFFEAGGSRLSSRPPSCNNLCARGLFVVFGGFGGGENMLLTATECFDGKGRGRRGKLR